MVFISLKIDFCFVFFLLIRTFAHRMENSIRHEGTIESIEGEHVRVRITQHSACSACKVASHCTASESREKIVDVFHCDHQDLKVGDMVVVCTSSHSAGKALMLGFGCPLLLIMGTTGILLGTGLSEAIAALAALGVLIPYYIILWVLRKHISNSIAFSIEKQV